jgi:hypothetical protein
MDKDWTMGAAQRDMRYGYLNGAPGVLVSACIWLGAAGVALAATPRAAVFALLAGGMFIHPLAVLVCKALGRPGRHGKGNPLAALAGECTVWMILGLVLAFGLSWWRSELFFPAALLVIGGRYLTFATLYGLRRYWAFGGALAVAGYGLAAAGMPMAAGALTGGAAELAFAIGLFLMAPPGAAGA